jgi:hypothetical protein
MKTYREQLDSVQKAIEAIETSGQEADLEVNLNRRSIKRGDLKELYRREAFLRRMVEREDGLGTSIVVPE